MCSWCKCCCPPRKEDKLANEEMEIRTKQPLYSDKMLQVHMHCDSDAKCQTEQCEGCDKSLQTSASIGDVTNCQSEKCSCANKIVQTELSGIDDKSTSSQDYNKGAQPCICAACASCQTEKCYCHNKKIQVDLIEDWRLRNANQVQNIGVQACICSSCNAVCQTEKCYCRNKKLQTQLDAVEQENCICDICSATCQSEKCRCRNKRVQTDVAGVTPGAEVALQTLHKAQIQSQSVARVKCYEKKIQACIPGIDECVQWCPQAMRPTRCCSACSFESDNSKLSVEIHK